MAEQPTTRRERKAQQTRNEILAASRTLFAERGYARTTVRDVADAADVSLQTVYDSVGSKRQLVIALNDLIDAEADIMRFARAAGESSDPEFIAGTGARITRSILDNCADIVRALVSGATDEPDLAAALADGHTRHVDGAQRVVGRLDSLGALVPGLVPSDAVASLAAFTDIRFALILLDSYGWKPKSIEQWMAEASRRMLLAR